MFCGCCRELNENRQGPTDPAQGKASSVGELHRGKMGDSVAVVVDGKTGHDGERLLLAEF